MNFVGTRLKWRILIVAVMPGLLWAGDWPEDVPVLIPGISTYSVSGVMTAEDAQPEFWFRLGYRSPTEYLFCVGNLDDGTPLLIASAQSTFFYDPLNGVLFEARNTSVTLQVGVDAGHFNCRFSVSPSEQGQSIDFRIDIRTLARGLSQAIRNDTGRRTGLTKKGTFLGFWNSPRGTLSRVIVDGGSYRADIQMLDRTVASLSPDSLRALRSVSRPAEAADVRDFPARLRRAMELLPLFGDEAARQRIERADGTNLNWDNLVRSHKRVRALLDDNVGVGPAYGGYDDGIRLSGHGKTGRALERWLEAVDAGDVRAMYCAGRALTLDPDLGDAREGLQLLRRSADLGYGPALTAVGLAYLHGRGCDPDYEGALASFTAAVARNVSRAKYELGWMYMRGQGTNRAPDKAVALWQDAALSGDPYSMTALGIVHEYGRGVVRNPTEAAVWYRKAADMGHREAMTRLARLYETGTGVPTTPRHAAELYQRAAELGDGRAQYEMARLCEHGIGVEQDAVQASAWLRKSARSGYARAQYALAHRVETREEKVKWLTEAARGGHVEAQFTLARAYLEGRGVGPDLPRGAAWLRVAADSGSKEAKERLPEVEKSLSEAQRVIWYARLREIEESLHVPAEGR